MKRILFSGLALLFFFTKCDTLNKIPTNTSGGLFSLNGNWQLASSSDNGALEGSVVTVTPGLSDASARTLNNNNYCLRERDILWRGLKTTQGGQFNLEVLVNACNNTSIYKAGTLTVLTNDEIRITSRTALGAELLQTWKRIPI